MGGFKLRRGTESHQKFQVVPVVTRINEVIWEGLDFRDGLKLIEGEEVEYSKFKQAVQEIQLETGRRIYCSNCSSNLGLRGGLLACFMMNKTHLHLKKKKVKSKTPCLGKDKAKGLFTSLN
ncbi:unnamed protein product [Rangifer tarandus platyrhynchus]|uniref:Uncharacterized protein n=2 Tax=Rangifer tarandus platyrhynchus TaxID=3082113 RepID=A0ABN8ZED6_RANTA|nr:unnamed protein product [Rangifer tarandus platyrhynchus]